MWEWAGNVESGVDVPANSGITLLWLLSRPPGAIGPAGLSASARCATLKVSRAS